MVADAELKLDVTFPVSYRRFLKVYGAVLCTGFELAGVFEGGNDDEPPLWSRVVTSTYQLRRGSRGSLPFGYVAVSDDGGDYVFFLDTSRLGPDGECPVVVLGPGCDGDIVAGSFIDFVIRMVAGRLEL
jgi:hypothetical protein